MRKIAVPCIFLVLIGKSGEISSTFHRIFWEIFAFVGYNIDKTDTTDEEEEAI